MRYARLVCLLGLVLAVGLGLLVATLPDPLEPVQADLAGALLRSVVSVVHNLRPFVVDLINAFVRAYL